MFTKFFYTLKNYGLPVSLNEWQSLLEALEAGLAGSSLTGFYYLGRAMLVKTEAHYDRYDMAFAAFFKDRNPGNARKYGNGWTKNCLSCR